MKLLLAPMDSITHQAFRNLVGRFGGCDEYFNEMINASSLLNDGPWEKFYLFEGPEPEKLVWQLTDKNGEKMAQAASVLAQKGGIGVDLNMGCSAPQIANTGAGVAWMIKPVSETQAMVSGVKSALENAAKDGLAAKRLSVKLRLGDENFTPEKLFSFTDMLVSEGVQMLTLHPRTKKEKYREKPRWNFVEELALRYPNIPVILNGAVKDKQSLEEAVKTAPHASGVMIARAAVQKPWIFAQLRALSGLLTEQGQSNEISFDKIDCEQLALDFISDVEEFQPPEFWKTRLQRFFAFYCLNFSFGHYFQTQMLNSKDNDDARSRLKEYFTKCPDDKFLSVMA